MSAGDGELLRKEGSSGSFLEVLQPGTRWVERRRWSSGSQSQEKQLEQTRAAQNSQRHF